MNTKAALTKKATLNESSEYQAMIRERDALNAKIEKLAAARLEAIAAVKTVVAKYALTVEDLFDGKNAKTAAKVSDTPAPAKKKATAAKAATKASPKASPKAAPKTALKVAKPKSKVTTQTATKATPSVAKPAAVAKKVVVKTGSVKAAGSISDANPLPFTIGKK